MPVSVRYEIDVALKGLTLYQRRQIPFAVAGALNNTAFDVRKNLIDEYARAFTVRNQVLPRTMWRVDKAKKSQLVAVVFDRLKLAFVPLQIHGGTKEPYRGSNVAIPTSAVKITARGKVAKRFQPGQLKNSFKGNPNGRGLGIYQRDKKGGIKRIHTLKSSVRIKQTYDAERVANTTVRRKFYGNLRRSLDRAILTAR